MRRLLRLAAPLLAVCLQAASCGTTYLSSNSIRSGSFGGTGIAPATPAGPGGPYGMPIIQTSVRSGVAGLGGPP